MFLTKRERVKRFFGKVLYFMAQVMVCLMFVLFIFTLFLLN